MKKVILISGKAGHGKDSLANILMKNLDAKTTKVPMARELKHLAKDYFGWNGLKDDSGRQLLQWLGTDYIRNTIDENFHVDKAIDTIRVLENFYDYIIIPDIRFANEIELLTKAFDCITVRVVRPNYKAPYSENELNHASEVELDNYQFDYTIVAEDLEELEEKANEIFEQILVDYIPVDELLIGEKVIVSHINNPNEAGHLLRYVGREGYVVGKIAFSSKGKRYKVMFHTGDTAYFRRHELKKIRE